VADPLDGLANLPLAVVIVAAAAGGARSCSTGTACYASLDPPLVVTPLAVASRTCELLRESGEFSLSVLAAGQAELAVRAAGPSAADKFAEQRIPLLESPPGRRSPGVAGSLTAIWCDLESSAEVGRYLLCVGRVREVATGASSRPLLRFRRRYHALGRQATVLEEAPYPL
jgi:3-hydroxy-9,10-secoandrosta-1,3,5(10)-triene-9,17-dione monooxygenase reductase component